MSTLGETKVLAACWVSGGRNLFRETLVANLKFRVKILGSKHQITGIRVVCIAVLLFGIQCFSLSGQNISFTSNIYTVGQRPVCIATADVNGDGSLDLISANAGDSTLTILTNNGHGMFAFKTSLNTFTNPFSVIAVDAKGDGKPDLICANGGQNPNYNNTLTLLTNNGSGYFGSNSTFTVGFFPDCIVAADIDGNGKLDLVSANGGDNTITVLTNNGNGGFGSNVTLNVGYDPTSVKAADLSGQGRVDLVTANFADGTLTVLTNNGSGCFGFNVTLTVGNGPLAVTAANLSGKGPLDLITANASDNTLTVLTNNGSGIFGYYSTFDVGYIPYFIVVADFNGDGKLDLISMNAGDNTCTVLTNDGSGGFEYSSTIGTGDGPMYGVAADLSGDGKLDLVCANNYENTLSVLRNTTVFLPPTSTPKLGINLVQGSVHVLWPSTSAGWSLQQSSDLTRSSWGPIGNIGYNVCDDGTNKSLTLPASVGSVWFRLLHP